MEGERDEDVSTLSAVPSVVPKHIGRVLKVLDQTETGDEIPRCVRSPIPEVAVMHSGLDADICKQPCGLGRKLLNILQAIHRVAEVVEVPHEPARIAAQFQERLPAAQRGSRLLN